MVRIFIRNGVCGVEEFFKLIGTKAKSDLFIACCKRESATFQELCAQFQKEVTDSALAKQLTEYINSGVLEILTYSNQESSCRTRYRVTQKAIDMLPIFDLMHGFCSEWLRVENLDVSEWVSYVRKLLGSRWNARIIWLLFVLRNVRFNEVKSSIEGISFKMLAQQLRFLVDEGVVHRIDYNENPPRVEYSLTPKGEALYLILLRVASWNTQYNKKDIPADRDESGLKLSI